MGRNDAIGMSPDAAAAASNTHSNYRSAHPYDATMIPRSQSEESWVEVSSRPSSSSLSSAADDIITDGLRVHHDSNLLRRRRMRRAQTDNPVYIGRHQHDAISSQEEYEASESESDRIMASSNEGLRPSGLQHEWRPSGPQFTLSSASSENAYASEDVDDVENATAIGVARGDHCFTPQPNAFSHPPSGVRSSAPQHASNSYFSPRPARPTQRPSHTAREQHSPYNIISPSHQADHDAALRASLSTLLSCAAAARGLPKSSRQSTVQSARATHSNRVDATTIGLMPESEIYGRSTTPERTSSHMPEAPSPIPTTDKSKRKIAQPTQRSSSKDRKLLKKARKTSANWTPATMEEINPTLLTWFVGAGVVVLVSALSFSAGYITGREAGRAEVLELSGGASEAGRCGKEAMIAGAGRGLKRLKWTDAASGIIV